MRAVFILPLLLLGCPAEPVDTTPAEPLGPMQTLTPDSVSFGAVAVGKEAAPVQVTIGNPGDEPLDVYTIALTEPELGLSIGSVGDGQRIPAGSEGTFIVKLTPADPGSLRSEVRISSNVTLPDDPAVIPISAEVVFPRLAADPDAVAVPDDARIEIVLTNSGDSLLTVTGAAVEGAASFGVDLDTGRNGELPWELEPVDGGFPKRSLYVTWDAESGTAADTGSLVLSSDGWEQPTLIVPLSVE